ncbi:MAG TPA: D-alanine--D-alanine ligase [Bacillota bacterium]|nr:D-alanine--D-alanine ligase [Bacillota bacterium]
MKKRVALIYGGKSAEREVSLLTGRQVTRALVEKGFSVTALDLDDNLVTSLKEARPDVVFIALHGKYGEDGCLQGLLDILDLPYVGSGVLASALAMNKAISKKLFRLEGLLCPKDILVSRYALKQPGLQTIIEQITKNFTYPLVVKPNKQGSTIGLTVVRSLQDLENAVIEASKYDDEVLVEEYISGTEITVGVLGDTEPQALPVIEIRSVTGLYDYEAKYTPGMSEHIIPAEISKHAYKAAQDAAIKAHRALGCRHISRSDFIVTPEDEVYILEVNTIPGMTQTSLVPDAAKAAGIEFSDLIALLVEFALDNQSPNSSCPISTYQKTGITH